MVSQQGFVQPLLPRSMLSRPPALCPKLSRPSVLSPLPSRLQAVNQRGPAGGPARTTTRACAADGATGGETSAADDEEDALHETWSVYSKPGNLCVVCNGRGASKCLYCFGEGKIRVGPEDGRDTVVCTLCDGRGTETCLRCHGSGIRPSTRIDLQTCEIVPNLTNEEVCQLANQAEVEALEAMKKAKAEEEEARQAAPEGTESGDVQAAASPESVVQ